ncbi:MAG: uncharacterized protein KVP18_000189 [Porospora cf. gigantea A]|uniref:uncharacterized protein n=3 Tax=Porospora cf. gigantea A TaxID=2853593 RepID=UPI00355A5508|nr:MAG: hypothetical protein KVP18_000189 [Porospora cf. gigantea A]
MGNSVGLDVTSNVVRAAVCLKEELPPPQWKQALDALVEGDLCPQYRDEALVLRFLSQVTLWGEHYRRVASGQLFYLFILNMQDVPLALGRFVDLIPQGQTVRLALTGSHRCNLRSMLETLLMPARPEETPHRRLQSEPCMSPSSMIDDVGPFQVVFCQEIRCLLAALNFLQLDGKAFFNYECTSRPMNRVGCAPPSEENFKPQPAQLDELYPFLLVNIKMGVSFHKVDSAEDYRRVGGSIIGGGTVQGLGSMLCPSAGRSVFDLFVLAQKGDNASVDMLVRDIYGGDYSHAGLSGGTIASSFGKLQPGRGERAPCEEDYARSVLTLMSYNTAQIAHFNCQLLGLKRVLFVGNYLELPGYLASLQHCLDFWGQGDCTTVFCRLAPFLGAMGAVVRSEGMLNKCVSC